MKCYIKVYRYYCYSIIILSSRTLSVPLLRFFLSLFAFSTYALLPLLVFSFKYYVSGHYPSSCFYLRKVLFIFQNTTFRRLDSVSVIRKNLLS
jgi:hypothetical protein